MNQLVYNEVIKSYDLHTINRKVPSLKGKGDGIWICIKKEKYGNLTYTPPPL